MCARVLSCCCGSVTKSCPTLCNPMDCSPPGSSVHGDSPGKNTGVGCHALLQGIFLTQESSCDLLHCRWILYQLSYQGYQGSLVAGKRFRNLLGMHYSYEKLHCTLHKMKDVNHHIIHIPALPTCITTAGMCSVFLPKMQSTTTMKIP